MLHRGQIVPVFDPFQRSKEKIDSKNEWFLLEPTIDPISLIDDEPSLTLPLPLPKSNELLWLYKPDGLLTLPGKSEPDSLATQVNQFLRTESSADLKPNWIPRPCHRLDQDTSGIIVMAKTRAAYTALSKQFEHRLVQKQYVALVHGKVQSNTGIIDSPIGHTIRNGHKVWTTDPNSEKPREAITHFHLSKHYTVDNSGYTRMILQPKTGRGHQLRLHMKFLGHPILGDTLHGYNSLSLPRINSQRLCLHAEYVEIYVTNSRNEVCKAKCWCLPPF